MRNLLTDPAWRAEDVGVPLPDSRHAVSVAMPRWQDVIDYEEERPALTSRLQAGYPRFFCAPCVSALFARAQAELGTPGEGSLVFPSREAAERCQAYVTERGGSGGRVLPFGPDGLGLHAVLFPETLRRTAREYWRYCGETVSTRLAAQAAQPASLEALATLRREGAAAGQKIRTRLAALAGVSPDDVFLYPSGMTAVFAAHRLLTSLHPDRPTVQLDFPYVDVLRIQQEFGAGVRFHPHADADALAECTRAARAGEIGGIFCEVPSNPLLSCVPVGTIATGLAGTGVPLVIDDTVATVVNVQALRYADIVTTSLTKSFSGSGDVMAGAVTLNPRSPHYAFFRDALAADTGSGCLLWCEDAIALERNSRDFPERVRRMDANAAALAAFLRAHPAVDQVWYPRATEGIADLLRPGAGLGCLLSFSLRDPAAAPGVYDRLRVSKGPSLGTNFTLASPYTLLAHYQELDWAASCGVPAHLIRVSAGLEETAELVSRFDAALTACPA